jgi:hypothetical protein
MSRQTCVSGWMRGASSIAVRKNQEAHRRAECGAGNRAPDKKNIESPRRTARREGPSNAPRSNTYPHASCEVLEALYDPNDQADYYQGTNDPVSKHVCLLAKRALKVRALKCSVEWHCNWFIRACLFSLVHD